MTNARHNETAFLTDTHSTHFQIWQNLKMLLSILSTSFMPKQTDSRSLSPSQQYFLPFPISAQQETLKHSQTLQCMALQGCRAPGAACPDHLGQPQPGRPGDLGMAPCHILPAACASTATSRNCSFCSGASELPPFPKAATCESPASIITPRLQVKATWDWFEANLINPVHLW